MNPAAPLEVFDCSLARYATGHHCTNLREMLSALRTISDDVLEHHMIRCALEDYFELYEFPNDFARWAWTALDDHVLGEQLGLIDPYRHESFDALRTELVNLLEDRLWHSDRLTNCVPGQELHLVGSRLLAYDTGARIATPVALHEALPKLSPRSIFYHVHEARRRTDSHSDDFSLWLEGQGVQPQLVADLRSLDFYYFNLNQLREAIIEVLERYLPVESSKHLGN